MYLRKEEKIKLLEKIKNKDTIIYKNIDELMSVCNVIIEEYNIPCNILKREDNTNESYVIYYNNCAKKFQYEVFGKVQVAYYKREEAKLWYGFSKENAMLIFEKLNGCNIELQIDEKELPSNLIVYRWGGDKN